MDLTTTFQILSFMFLVVGLVLLVLLCVALLMCIKLSLCKIKIFNGKASETTKEENEKRQND